VGYHHWRKALCNDETDPPSSITLWRDMRKNEKQKAAVKCCQFTRSWPRWLVHSGVDLFVGELIKSLATS
jgi:hypothetical protein